ncbi:MAG: cell division protein FtsA [bacterium]
MAKMKFIAGLDIGTSKVCAIIGHPNEQGEMEILGVGTAPSTGINKGMVADLDKTIKSIERAVAEAEGKANVDVESLYVSVGGGYIKSQPSRGVIAISRSDKEITKNDVSQVIEQARAIPLPLEQDVIHVIPQKFLIDDQNGISDPLGMSGVRLETEVFIVTGTGTFLQNLSKCVNRAGFRIEDLTFGTWAASKVILSSDEKELGVALVDIGGGKVDIVIFIEGRLCYTGSLPFGGSIITRDIAFGLKTSLAEAEEIKKTYGCAWMNLVKETEKIAVTGLGNRETRKITRRSLSEIIEPRIEEILELINTEIQKSGYVDLLPAGVVMTGGTSLMEGIRPFAEQVLHMDVRIGAPHNVPGLSEELNNPAYSVSVGLIQHGIEQRYTDTGIIKPNSGGRLNPVIRRIKSWVEEAF